MNLLNFTSQFPDGRSCKLQWKACRDKHGVECPHCGSKLHFRYWFVAIYLLTSTKKSFSASELQRQPGHKKYDPIWATLHKLRAVMGQRDGRYQQEGIIELDECFFTTEKEGLGIILGNH